MIPLEPAFKAKRCTQGPLAFHIGRRLILSLLTLCGLIIIPRSEAAGSKWMSQIDNSMPISRITIPGTHDSGARLEPFPATAKCQTHTIAEQLDYGIRFLDMRCRHIGDSFAIHHGPIYQEIFFGEVLTQVYEFLDANPSEC
ncbi:MAG: phosphatidylinositol-specific phospholipase C domain-containing protein, partial [Luteolibacter sp.]